jgi:hypothetical protein
VNKQPLSNSEVSKSALKVALVASSFRFLGVTVLGPARVFEEILGTHTAPPPHCNLMVLLNVFDELSWSTHIFTGLWTIIQNTSKAFLTPWISFRLYSTNLFHRFRFGHFG